MARYTKKDSDGRYYIESANGKLESNIKGHTYGEAIDRLAELENANVAPIAETVQKYKSAIIEYYSKPQYQPTKEHPIKHTQIEFLFAVIDQIAKEMLEGEKGETANEN